MINQLAKEEEANSKENLACVRIVTARRDVTKARTPVIAVTRSSDNID